MIKCLTSAQEQKTGGKVCVYCIKLLDWPKKQLEHASFLLSHLTWCTGPYLICCCWAMVLDFGECRERAGGESLRDTEQGKSRNNLKVIYIEERPAQQIQGYIWLSTHCISSQVKIWVSYAPTSKHNPNIQIKTSTHHLQRVTSDESSSLSQASWLQTCTHTVDKIIN